jgi:leucyl aminopeptidase
VNRPVPTLDSRSFSGSLSKKSISGISHIALPVGAKKSEDDDFEILIPKRWQEFFTKEFDLDFQSEFKKAGANFSGKPGDLIEISILPGASDISRFYLVAVGERALADLRKTGAILGRKVKGTKATLLTLIPQDSEAAQVHMTAMALATYSWSAKGGAKPETPSLEVVGDFDLVIEKCRVLVEATWRARDLIHTPSNLKSPAWIAAEAQRIAKHPQIKIKVRAGRELKEFGGLLAVGNSSRSHSPRFVEVVYKPKKQRVPHVVLVGKGITFDTGGVSLKRPYDTMMAMKSDMAGAASVLMTVYAAAKLKLDVHVTGLLMLAENALSGTSQRPSDVITHYGGTTVEVINTDAEGRLVLADGLAYADENLEPDYLIDIATLTGAATLGLSRHYGAMYTRDHKLARKLHEIGEFVGDRIWHMPLVDDYSIALESNVADYNHTADKFKFQGGSVTAALFLEKFVGDRRWVHMDIAGPARSEVDAGENPKGGTGYGVRLLTEWLASL